MTTESEVALRSIKGHAKRITEATAARDRAIEAARAAGVPLRTIAAAAGITHQTVQNILDRRALASETTTAAPPPRG